MRSFEDFQIIEKALNSMKTQLNTGQDNKVNLEKAEQNFVHSLSHATNIEENILRVSLE